MSKRMKNKIMPRDYKVLNNLRVSTYYPPGQDRAQLRGGKPSFPRIPPPSREGR